jgi:signal transduction histidine kinase
MRSAYLEPGILKLFRLFLIVQLLLIYGNVCAHSSRGYLGGEPWIIPVIATGAILLLLVYLSIPRLQLWLGRFYLPIALVVTALFSLVTQDILLSTPDTLTRESTEENAWQLFLFLFVPLVLTGWQYGFSAVLVFCICTGLLDHLILVHEYPEIYSDSSTHARLIFIRTFSFLFVGYIISRIVQELRQQRLALQQANMKLTRYATTLEQLSVSRERNRMARELHDTLAHTLTAVAVQLEGVKSLWTGDSQKSFSMLEASLAATRSGLTETRKAIQALRASPVDDLGIALAIRELAEAASERAGFALQFEGSELDWELPSDVEQCLYRVAQEALENIVKHARAQQVRVSMSRVDGKVWLTIADDGEGIDRAAVEADGHYGLRGMCERAEMLGGRCSIESQPGLGTHVLLELSDHA